MHSGVQSYPWTVGCLMVIKGTISKLTQNRNHRQKPYSPHRNQHIEITRRSYQKKSPLKSPLRAQLLLPRRPQVVCEAHQFNVDPKKSSCSSSFVSWMLQSISIESSARFFGFAGSRSSELVRCSSESELRSSTLKSIPADCNFRGSFPFCLAGFSACL